MARRKGLGKGKGRGYRNIQGRDPKIHSDSARGIKQPQKIPEIRKPKPNPPPTTSDEENTIIERYSFDTLKDIKNEIAESLGQKPIDVNIEKVREEDKYIELEVSDGSQYGAEFVIYDSEDDAEEEAKDRVREDLENDPEMFTSSFIESHIDIENLKNQLESDLDESNRSYWEDIESESDINYGTRAIQELVELGELDDDDVLDKDGDAKDSSEIEEYDEAVERAVDDRTKEQLEDPIGYLEDIYGEEEARKQAIRIGGLDIDEATDDAIATDGWQHFMSTYDGNSTDLKGGQVMFRTN